MLAPLLLSLLAARALAFEKPVLPSEQGKPCYDIPDPLTRKFVEVDCLHNAIAKRAIDPSGTAPSIVTVRRLPSDLQPRLTSPRQPVTTGAPSLPSAAAAIPQGFRFSFNCRAPADRPNYCEQAQASFEIAGQILSDIIELKRTITVNVSLYTFCEGGVCLGSDGPTNLGAAG
jgi:hypothetical protein